MLITDFKCIRLSLYVKMKIKQNLTNVISTKIAVQFFFLMGCYWLNDNRLIVLIRELKQRRFWATYVKLK